jgi:hypothetical protein
MIEPSASTTLSAGRFFAVVVGTSTFSFGDPKMNLTFPTRDAESIATGLRLGAERLYGKDNVWMRVLTSDANSDDSLPTKKNMGRAADAVSYEASKYGEGLLTYALLEGMRGASLDDGSWLGVSRWFQNASEQVPDLARSIGGIQKPVIVAPKGRGFPVSLLTVEDRAKIPLALARPQLLRVICSDEDDLDPLHLRDQLREQMRALSYAQVRGAEDPQVEYLDATDDDLPGAFSPRLRYRVSGDTVTVRIRLIANE